MSTREKIIEVSLELFAKRGFSGVSVRDIAKEVGVRESALYKHFKNKQDILDQIILEMKDRIHQAYMEQQVPEVVSQDVAKGYRDLSAKAAHRPLSPVHYPTQEYRQYPEQDPLRTLQFYQAYCR